MTKKSDAPAIRFKGFSDAWEQRKLSELTSMHARIGWQNLRTSEFLDSGDYMLITGTDFNDGAINFSTCHYVERERYEQDRNIQIHNGSILITKDGTLGKVAYVQGLSMPATLNAGVFNVQIKDANNVDERYLFQYLKAPFLMDYVDKKATGGTIKHLNQSILVDFPVILPQRSEQILIGAFFQQLDILITLHQRKFEKLTNVKKSMLEKMFPQNGSSYPEIRFKGFTDPWEQRKLNEVVNVYDGVHQTPDYKESGVMFLSVENISTLKSEKYISEEAFQRDYKVYPQKGDILMTRIGDVGTPNVVETTEKVAFYVSLALLKPTKINSYFLCNSIQSPLFQKGLKDRTLVTAIPQKINKDEIGKVNIILPTSSQEQQLIGEYFANLDRLITLHQRELEKLQNIKKSMLEKMFV